MSKIKMNLVATAPEHKMTEDEAKQYFTNKIMRSRILGNGHEIDGDIINKAREYGVEGSIQDQVTEISESVIQVLQGVEGNFEEFTVEALERMNKEYFMRAVDAAYSQDTMAPDLMAQGIGASELKNGNVFTTAELLETAPYIVDDMHSCAYQAISLAEYTDEASKYLSDDREITADFGDEADLKNALVFNTEYHAALAGQSLADALEDLTEDDLALEA